MFIYLHVNLSKSVNVRSVHKPKLNVLYWWFPLCKISLVSGAFSDWLGWLIFLSLITHSDTQWTWTHMLFNCIICFKSFYCNVFFTWFFFHSRTSINVCQRDCWLNLAVQLIGVHLHLFQMLINVHCCFSKIKDWDIKNSWFMWDLCAHTCSIKVNQNYRLSLPNLQ